MAKYILKSALVAEIERKISSCYLPTEYTAGIKYGLGAALKIIDTLEVKDPYEQVIQYPSIEDGIKAHAEDYSWNIESELFQQLTPEQQKLWRKEIEQAVISGGYSGLNFARDTRYKENLEVKEVEEEPVTPIDVTRFYNDGLRCGVEAFARIVRTHLCEMTADSLIQFKNEYRKLTGDEMFGAGKD